MDRGESRRARRGCGVVIYVRTRSVADRLGLAEPGPVRLLVDVLFFDPWSHEFTVRAVGWQQPLIVRRADLLADGGQREISDKVAEITREIDEVLHADIATRAGGEEQSEVVA